MGLPGRTELLVWPVDCEWHLTWLPEFANIFAEEYSIIDKEQLISVMTVTSAHIGAQKSAFFGTVSRFLFFSAYSNRLQIALLICNDYKAPARISRQRRKRNKCFLNCLKVCLRFFSFRVGFLAGIIQLMSLSTQSGKECSKNVVFVSVFFLWRNVINLSSHLRQL